MSLGEIVREKREQLGLTQDQAASHIGISKPYLSNIETGKAKNPPTDGILKGLERVLHFRCGELTRLAHLARTPLDVRAEHELLEAEVQKLRAVLKEMLSGSRRKNAGKLDLNELSRQIHQTPPGKTVCPGLAVPVINKVGAGYPNFTTLDYPSTIADEYIRFPDLHDAQAFAARVVGDSMQPQYHEGDLVIFSPNTTCRSGDDCFALFQNGSSTTFKRFYQDSEDTLRLQPLNPSYPAALHRRKDIKSLWPAVFRIQRLK